MPAIFKHLNFQNLVAIISSGLLLCLPLHSMAQQKETYDVFVVEFASSDQQFYESDWALDAPSDVKVPISFMFWLLKGSGGRNILVDAGFLPVKVKEEEYFKLVNYIRPDSALMKLGISPGEVTDIIISHPHWDHIGGIGLFPNASIWMQNVDYQGFVGAAWQKGNSGGGFAKEDVRLIVDLNLAGRLHLVNGDNKEILPGITVFTGSKHTYDSQYVLVNNGKENVVIASDNIWVYYSLDHLVPPSLGGTSDPKGYVDAIKRMKKFVSDPKYILPGHDSRILKRFSNVSKGIAVIK